MTTLASLTLAAQQTFMDQRAQARARRLAHEERRQIRAARPTGAAPDLQPPGRLTCKSTHRLHRTGTGAAVELEQTRLAADD